MQLSKDRHIVGFSDSRSLLLPVNNAFSYFEMLKGMSSKPKPNIVYIGAAKGDNPERIKLFKTVCFQQNCTPLIFSVYNMNSDKVEEYFCDADIIYIDGGVTRNLMALLKEWKATEALLLAYQSGIILSGASAGINLFFEWCITDSVKSNLTYFSGLGVLKGSMCPHFDVRPDRVLTFENALLEKKVSLPAYGLDEGVCTVFKNEILVEVYSLTAEADLHIYDEVGGWSPSPKTFIDDQSRER